jgi:hypothetical protein
VEEESDYSRERMPQTLLLFDENCKVTFLKTKANKGQYVISSRNANRKSFEFTVLHTGTSFD